MMGKEMNVADAMVWAYSGRSHMYKEQNTFFPHVLTFPGETITWVGQAVSSAYGTFSGGSKAVDIGISPYRLVFAKTGIVDKQCRSFWFQVEFGDWIFEYKKGMLSKTKKYHGFKLSEPRTKKGLTNTFEFDVLGQLKNGEWEPFHITHEFSYVKGLDTQSSKYKRKLAEDVFRALEEGYQNQKPVSIDDLFIFFFDHSRFDELTFALPENAQADQTKPPAPPDEIAEQIQERRCPVCGETINPDAKFCGSCGKDLTAAAKSTDALESAEEKAPAAPEPQSAGEEKEEAAAATEPKPEHSCPSCGKPVEKGWSVCPYCATPLETRCPACEKEIEPDWLACPYCGQRLKDA
jgi:hypothetical protein